MPHNRIAGTYASTDVTETLRAILFQLEHGEASDLCESDDPSTDSARRDLLWCRDILRDLIDRLGE